MSPCWEGKKLFSSAAPCLWPALPYKTITHTFYEPLRVCKSLLVLPYHLFKMAFSKHICYLLFRSGAVFFCVHTAPNTTVLLITTDDLQLLTHLKVTWSGWNSASLHPPACSSGAQPRTTGLFRLPHSQRREKGTSPERSSNHPEEEKSCAYNTVGLRTPGFLA